MRKLNVGLVGGGFMAKAHSLAYAAMPMFFWPAPAVPVRKAIADVNWNLANDARNRYGYEKTYADWRDLVADDDVDIIDIVTPNDSHAEIAIAAAKAGKHILCEKPLARSAKEAGFMLKASRKRELSTWLPLITGERLLFNWQRSFWKRGESERF